MILLKTLNKYLPIITILCIIVIWEGMVRLLNIPTYILPGPYSIIKILVLMRSLILSHTLTTLYETTAGFGISIIIGLLISVIMSRSDTIRRVIYPLMVISQTIPIIALAPIIIIWLGVGILPKIFIVVIVCFFPICINTTTGLLSADKDMINLMKVMGAGYFKIFKDVNLPCALPNFFAGLKIAAAYSIMGAVIGEWLGAKSGLGIFMTRSMSSYRADMLFAAITVVVVLSMLIFKLIEIIEKIAIPWDIKNIDIEKGDLT